MQEFGILCKILKLVGKSPGITKRNGAQVRNGFDESIEKYEPEAMNKTDSRELPHNSSCKKDREDYEHRSLQVKTTTIERTLYYS